MKGQNLFGQIGSGGVRDELYVVPPERDGLWTSDVVAGTRRADRNDDQPRERRGFLADDRFVSLGVFHYDDRNQCLRQRQQGLVADGQTWRLYGRGSG